VTPCGFVDRKKKKRGATLRGRITTGERKGEIKKPVGARDKSTLESEKPERREKKGNFADSHRGYKGGVKSPEKGGEGKKKEVKDGSLGRGSQTGEGRKTVWKKEGLEKKGSPSAKARPVGNLRSKKVW